MNVLYYRYSQNHINIICSEKHPYIWLPANSHFPICVFGHAVFKLHVYSTKTNTISNPLYGYPQFTIYNIDIFFNIHIN
ncbi:hypothetical protein M5D96_014137 [Drosophila gunungcola]|uniref:Uncharacterized protein n=1 Tax=Drosophila gunungcola TaxID=103775 RepID=A0A9Q0BHM8_9MUSC|nr:hypothetical protein M5D96_014137 [Drosophila gunungcola]